MTYSFLQKFLGAPFAPEMTVDLLQCFPANCLYGGRNRKNSIYISFDMEEPYITIDTYHEQMCEALCALRSGLRFYENASQLEEDDLEKGDLYLDAGSIFEPTHARDAIRDILAFISWVAFDVCEYSIEDGSMRLGFGSRSSTGDVILLADEYGFDTRSFGR